MQYSTSYRFESNTAVITPDDVIPPLPHCQSPHTGFVGGLYSVYSLSFYCWAVKLHARTHARAYTHTACWFGGLFYLAAYLSLKSIQLCKITKLQPSKNILFHFLFRLKLSVFYLQRLSTFNHQNESHIQHMSQWETHVSYLSLTLCSREGTQNSASLICCL